MIWIIEHNASPLGLPSQDFGLPPPDLRVYSTTVEATAISCITFAAHIKWWCWVGMVVWLGEWCGNTLQWSLCRDDNKPIMIEITHEWFVFIVLEQKNRRLNGQGHLCCPHQMMLSWHGAGIWHDDMVNGGAFYNNELCHLSEWSCWHEMNGVALSNDLHEDDELYHDWNHSWIIFVSQDLIRIKILVMCCCARVYRIDWPIVVGGEWNGVGLLLPETVNS